MSFPHRPWMLAVALFFAMAGAGAGLAAHPGDLLPLGLQSREALGSTYGLKEARDGAIWVLGDFWSVNGQPRAGLARLESGGQLSGFSTELGMEFLTLGTPWGGSVYRESLIHPLPDGGALIAFPSWNTRLWAFFDASGKERAIPWSGLPRDPDIELRGFHTDATHFYYGETPAKQPYDFRYATQHLRRIHLTTGERDEQFHFFRPQTCIPAFHPADEGKWWVMTAEGEWNSPALSYPNRASGYRMHRLLADGREDPAWPVWQPVADGINYVWHRWLPQDGQVPWPVMAKPASSYWPPQVIKTMPVDIIARSGDGAAKSVLKHTSLSLGVPLAGLRGEDYLWTNIQDRKNRLRRFDTGGKLQPQFPSLLLEGVRADTLANGDLLLNGSQRYTAAGVPASQWAEPRLRQPAAVSRVAQAGGKLWVQGNWKEWNGVPAGPLQRLHGDGSLDQTFQWQPPQGYSLTAWSVAPSGLVYVLMTETDGFNTWDWQVLRLRENGAVDPTFVPWTDERKAEHSAGYWGDPKALEVLDEGSVMLGYFWPSFNGRPGSWRWIKLNADGAWDEGFPVLSGNTPWGSSLFPLKAGGFWLAGRKCRRDGSIELEVIPSNALRFSVIYHEWPDGRLLAWDADFRLRRFHADGQEDLSFLSPEFLSLLGNTFYSAAALPDGGAVVVLNDLIFANDEEDNQRLVLLQPDGSVNHAFRGPMWLNRNHPPVISETIGAYGRFRTAGSMDNVFSEYVMGQPPRVAAVLGDALWIGGEFNHVGSERRDGLAALALEKVEGYAAWAAAVWRDEPEAPRGFDEDADGDGASNGLEYALGIHPRRVEAEAAQLSIESRDPLVLAAPRNFAAPDVSVVLETSEDGLTWRVAHFLEAAPLPSLQGLRFEIQHPRFALPDAWPPLRLFRLRAALKP